MKEAKLIESRGETYFLKGRGIPKGCQLCLIGAKTVLFLNGMCQNPEHCYWYCPISNERKGKKSTFANEIMISSKEELFDEIEKTNAKGMSITGGDPLFKPNVEETIEYIKYIKLKKGKKFHIHLYTNGLNFNESIAKKLVEAGLDEIRFNPPKKYWGVIKYALNKDMAVGAEVPVIPKKDYIQYLEEFIIYLNKIRADFINLNEFEYSYPNSQYLKEKGFKLIPGTIASVENSKVIAFDLIKRIKSKVSLKIHFCPIISKDYWQLKERYLRRAKNIKLIYEEISEEGLLLYAQIEGKEENLTKFNWVILNQMNIPQKFISFNKKNIKLPISFALEEYFLKLLEDYNLEGYIIEKTPFREEKYCQITEKTPIKVFKEEIGFYEN